MSESCSAEDVAVTARVDHDKTKLLFQNAGMAQAVVVANACVLMAVLGDPLARPWAVIWFLMVTAVALARYLYARRFLAAGSQRQDGCHWRGGAIRWALLAGSLWGGGIGLFMVTGDGTVRLFAALVLSGMVAGAVPILSAVPAAFRSYALPAMSGVILSALLDYRTSADAMLVIVALLFIFAVLKSSKLFHASLDQALRSEYSMQEMLGRLERSREAAEMASAAKSMFLGNMSHELRTPLNGVLGMADVLSLTELSNEQQEYLSSLQSQAKHLHAMVEDVLFLAQLDGGELSLQKAPFDLDETLKIGLRSHAELAAGKGLQWELSFAPGMVCLRNGDSQRLKQAVARLVDNAVKFTAQGKVKVGVGETADGVVCIEISDTGPGLTPVQCDAVLTDFTQADATRTRRHAGLGIGLTLTRRIVRLLEGRLEVDSTPGQGSTFRLVIPLPVASIG